MPKGHPVFISKVYPGHRDYDEYEDGGYEELESCTMCGILHPREEYEHDGLRCPSCVEEDEREQAIYDEELRESWKAVEDDSE